MYLTHLVVLQPLGVLVIWAGWQSCPFNWESQREESVEVWLWC